MMRVALAFAVLALALPALAGVEVDVPFTIDRDHGVILVRLTVNRREAVFIVDTGSTTTVLSLEAANVTKLDIGRSRFSSDGPGLDVQGKWTTATVEIGRFQLRQYPVVATDMVAVSHQYGRKIDGLLGQDFLRRFRSVTIDFGAGVMHMAE